MGSQSFPQFGRISATKRNRAYTLTEMVAVISVLGVLLPLMMQLLASLMHMQTESARSIVQTQTVARLSALFRSDVHASTGFRLTEDVTDATTTKLELTLPGSTVTYRTLSYGADRQDRGEVTTTARHNRNPDHVLERIVATGDNGKPIHREAFSLRGEFQMSEEAIGLQKGLVVELVCEPPSSRRLPAFETHAGQPDPRTRIPIAAVFGADYRQLTLGSKNPTEVSRPTQQPTESSSTNEPKTKPTPAAADSQSQPVNEASFRQEGE